MSKVILITGGSSGIGKSIGEYLLHKGHIVYGTSRTPENYPNSEFKLLPLDVASQNSINSAIATLIETHQCIDVLINNAGVGITGPIEELPEHEIKQHFNTNVFGPLRVIKAALPQLRKQGFGLIINITSIAGYMGLPFRGVYSAGKGALNILTEAYRMELKAFNIKMTTIAPGDFATDIASRRFHAPVNENSPYKSSYGAILKTINNDVNSGGDPLAVAKLVLKVMNTKTPKVHYKVGAFMQKFSIVLKALLPSKIYEKLLLNHYKL